MTNVHVHTHLCMTLSASRAILTRLLKRLDKALGRLQILQLTKSMARRMPPKVGREVYHAFGTSTWTYDLCIIQLDGSALNTIHKIDVALYAAVVFGAGATSRACASIRAFHDLTSRGCSSLFKSIS